MLGDIIELRFLPLLLLYGIGLSAVFGLGALLFHLFVTQAELSVHNEPAGARLGFLEPTVAVLILFTITASWLRNGDLIGFVQEETGRMNLLGHAALTLPEPLRSRLVGATADYATAVGAVEWPGLRHGAARSAAASDALQALTRAYSGAAAGGPRERVILRHSNRLVRELAEQREARLTTARYPHGDLLQGLLVVTLGVTLTISWFFGATSLASKLVLGTMFAFSVSLALVFNQVMAHAFDGPGQVDASAYLELAQSLRAALAAKT